MEIRRHGGQVLFGKDVRSAARDEVRTSTGEVFYADAVVLAPGVWGNDQLLKDAPPLQLLRPARGAMAPVSLPAPLKANLRGPGFYLARRSGDDVVLGATLEFDSFKRFADASSVAGLFKAAEEHLPGVVKPHVERRPWAGVRPMSPDWAPFIGPCANGVYVACGHSRNGWLLAPVTAEILCAYVFEQALSPLWSAFHPERHSAKS
jgi:glycine oxidase